MAAILFGFNALISSLGYNGLKFNVHVFRFVYQSALREYPTKASNPLQWRHNEGDSVSNHQPHDCLFNRLFGRRSKKTSKLCVTGLCAGNSPGTGEFPAQTASNAENVSIWWRHHAHRLLQHTKIRNPCTAGIVIRTPVMAMHVITLTNFSEKHFVPWRHSDNKAVLAPLMAWYWKGNKAVSLTRLIQVSNFRWGHQVTIC